MVGFCAQAKLTAQLQLFLPAALPYRHLKYFKLNSRTPRAGARCNVSVGCAPWKGRFPVGASPTRQPLQPEAIGAVTEVTKWLKPSISRTSSGHGAPLIAVQWEHW